NAPVCHGAGLRHKTLSDLVAEVEFVNARGELQTVSDAALLKAAAGCFGLLGIVTSLTLKLDPMTYATLRPESPRLPLAIPPPAGFPVPSAVDMSGISQADLEEAERLSDDIIVIDHGRVIARGDARDRFGNENGSASERVTR
ncbi:MAG: hypothetical protein KY463_11750, partial [Actinobacteria bacterium]|nr:hypothetical protein [Actinomycetota bacterium]